MEFTINYAGVAIATVALIVLGFLWYGPIFGKKWTALMGFTDADMAKMKERGMAISYVGMLVTTVLTVYVLAMVLQWGNAVTFVEAMIVAFLVWLGFVMTTQAGSVLWEGRSWSLFFLNTLYSLVALFLAAGILVWLQ